jgi:hypothetical protein
MDPIQPPAARIAAIIGAALIFVCLVCSACSAAGATTTSSGPPTTPTTAATPTIATSTPTGSTKVNGPYLGGTESDFQAAFGAPTLNASQSRHYETTLDGIHVLVIALVGAGGVTDRMRFLRIAPADQGLMWDVGTGEAMAKQFLPPDSKYQRDKQAPDAGTEHVYLSQLLAASFPASVFFDIDTDAPLPPGTFDYYCGGVNNTDGGCALLLGA